MTRSFTADRRLITGLRLAAQRLAAREFAEPVDVVRHLTAMQAQDFPGAKWSIGLRMTSSTDAGIEAGDLAAAERIARTALASGPLGRRELLAAFEEGGQPTANQRGAHLLLWLAQNRVTVFGPVDGKQHTFALFDDWIRASRSLEGEEALAELATRYFRSHGPATDRDFAWWSSLTLSSVRAAIAAAGDRLASLEVGGMTYFHKPGLEPVVAAVLALPGFDEYLLGYSDRSAALAPAHADVVVPGGNGMFMPTIVVDGEVVGTWRRTTTSKTVRIEARPFTSLSVAARKRFERACRDYGTFLGLEAVVA